jgi:endonuclease/exonuclease/phosphatase family metal-dependent hydrolase
MNVYGAAQDKLKNDFLAEMASMCSKVKEPLLISGDFNILRFSSEKNKKFLPNRFSKIFNSLIHLYELKEIDISGGQYTWSNNQSNPTLENLDRVLMSGDWENKFSTVQVHKHPREVSDHNPLSCLLGKEIETKREILSLSYPGFKTMAV